MLIPGCKRIIIGDYSGKSQVSWRFSKRLEKLFRCQWKSRWINQSQWEKFLSWSVNSNQCFLHMWHGFEIRGRWVSDIWMWDGGFHLVAKRLYMLIPSEDWKVVECHHPASDQLTTCQIFTNFEFHHNANKFNHLSQCGIE